jgi:Fe-S cluster biosynthesis and repair protein YggX
MTPTERAEQIARYRNMAQGDPDDDLAHFRLGQALMEDGQLAEAVAAFERTLVLSPGFSRVYQYLGECLIKLEQKEKAVEVLTRGWKTADERGDRLPREAMAKLLVSLGAPVPVSAPPTTPDDGPETGFKCRRPGCMEGRRAKPLTAAPLPDAIGERILQEICSACWTLWWKDLSVKIINENRYDLSSEFHQQEYDRHMRDFLGFEDEPKA